MALTHHIRQDIKGARYLAARVRIPYGRSKLARRQDVHYRCEQAVRLQNAQLDDAAHHGQDENDPPGDQVASEPITEAIEEKEKVQLDESYTDVVQNHEGAELAQT